MKRFLTLLLLLCTLPCFAARTLVQSNMGGTLNATANPPLGGTFNTTSVGFTSTTTAGSTLVCVTYLAWQSSLSIVQIPSSSCVTSGISWTLIAGADSLAWGASPLLNSGNTKIFVATNAPSITPATTTHGTTTVTTNANASCNVQMEFMLYEFGGTTTTNSFEPSGASTPQNTGSNSVPQTQGGSFTTTGTDDLLLESFASSGGTNVTAGTGWTLGINATTPIAGPGQFQYQLDAPAATYPSTYGGTITGSWLAIARGVFAGAGPPPTTIIKRHSGVVF